MFYQSLQRTLSNLESWLYITWLTFLVRYRKTAIGPAWLVVGPALFIAVLGVLYSEIGGIPPIDFIPHLTIGLVTWTLINGFVTGSTTVFHRNQSKIMQGATPLTDLAMLDVLSTVLQFLHQLILVPIVFIIVGRGVSSYALLSIVGVALLIANGVWLTIVFGIIGARYRDLSEIVQAVMRIAFLATPIMWIPNAQNRSDILEAFLVFNPFYHFLELVRAPLMGKPIAPISWLVAIVITALGYLLASAMYERYSRQVSLWV